MNLLNQSDIYTIINQIPTSQSIATKVEWSKFRLKGCSKKDGLYDKSSGQIFYQANTFTAYINDWRRYKKPSWIENGYYTLPRGELSKYYTVNVGDLLIFSDIADSAPTTVAEFNALREKYRGNGGIITASEVYISYHEDGTPWKTNHIEIVKG